MKREVLTGVPVSPGLARGRARLIGLPRLPGAPETIAETEVETELLRLEEALATARGELADLRRRLSGALAHELGDFFDAHALLLEDPELVQGLFDLVRKARMSARAALKVQRDRLAEIFAGIEDPYLRSRFEDVEHVIARVLAWLNRAEQGEEASLRAGEGEVVVAETLPPAELAHFAEQGVRAVITEQGSPLSHAAILARSLRLPMVVQARGALAAIGEGDLLLVDAAAGQIVVNPEAADLAAFERALRRNQREERRLLRLRDAPCRTRDGIAIELLANAESLAEVEAALAHGAAGIGLYRTEFLFLREDRLPDEEEQFEAYRAVLRAACGRPVTFRTLDLGADKAEGSVLALPSEENPALGLRGLRRSLSEPEQFAAQLRAVIRAAELGPARVLLPMVTTASEFAAARRLHQHLLAELSVPAEQPVPLGAMIEVPAAAIAPEAILALADFAAIGSNDLMQYLLAADRGHDRLAGLFEPTEPAVVRTLARLIAACARRRRPVTLCGELAADTRFTALLIALGLRALSAHPRALPAIKERIRELDTRKLQRLRPRLLRATHRESVEKLLAAL